MSVVIVLILASLTIGLIFLGAFVWAVRCGQYEDTLTPALRVLAEDDFTPPGKPAASVPAAANNQERQNTKP
jgi:cbb3-type cytochrome oxidase maturation protein